MKNQRIGTSVQEIQGNYKNIRSIFSDSFVE